RSSVGSNAGAATSWSGARPWPSSPWGLPSSGSEHRRAGRCRCSGASISSGRSSTSPSSPSAPSTSWAGAERVTAGPLPSPSASPWPSACACATPAFWSRSCRLALGSAPQRPSQHLPHQTLRELVNEADRRRALVTGQALGAELDHLALLEVTPPLRDHVGL